MGVNRENLDAVLWPAGAGRVADARWAIWYDRPKRRARPEGGGMSWSFGGKATDAGFAAEVRRTFDLGEGQVRTSPAAVRAVRAIREFVEQAPLNIPAGCTVWFETNGHLEQNGRGSLTVKVTISDTPAETPDAAESSA